MGVGVGLPEIKPNSAKFQVKLPTGAELGNDKLGLSSAELKINRFSNLHIWSMETIDCYLVPKFAPGEHFLVPRFFPGDLLMSMLYPTLF